MSTYLWHDGSFIPHQPHPGPFDVADSWRMLGDAHSNGLHLHLRRLESVAGPLPAGFVPAMLQLFAPGRSFSPYLASRRTTAPGYSPRSPSAPSHPAILCRT